MSSDKDLCFEDDLFHASLAVAAIGIHCQENVIAVGNVQCDALSEHLPRPYCNILVGNIILGF